MSDFQIQFWLGIDYIGSRSLAVGPIARVAQEVLFRAFAGPGDSK